MTERHPFEPFLPRNARLLMLGTFPPAEKRWAMKFYYPNFTNDMWRIVGICFYGDKQHFVRQAQKTYDLPAITAFLQQQGIALFDTALQVVRTTGTASDKDLQIIEETPVDELLIQLPNCKAVVTAGQLATAVVCRQMGVAEPRVGEWETFTCDGREMRLYRMPSSSRAYPMAVEKKADYYKKVFDFATK